MSERRFPPPWTLEKIPGGLKVCDANGQSLATWEPVSQPPHQAANSVIQNVRSGWAELPMTLATLPDEPE